jgi:cytochrome c553
MITSKSLLLMLAALMIFSNEAIAEANRVAPGASAEIGEQDKYASIRENLKTCFTCHGDNGQSKLGTFPILAGQEFYYMYVQLKDMKTGLRESQVMGPIVANIEKADLKLLAMFFSEQKWPETSYEINAKQSAIGQRVIDEGGCTACHLATLKGNSRIPRLANQHPEYLKNTMHDFRNGVRNNAPAMASLLKTYSDEDIDAIVNYLGSFEE